MITSGNAASPTVMVTKNAAAAVSVDRKREL
jgi:hypothetical protein